MPHARGVAPARRDPPETRRSVPPKTNTVALPVCRRRPASGNSWSSTLRLRLRPDLRACRNHSSFNVTPERNEQLAGHGHNRDPPCTSCQRADAVAEPLCQLAARLVAKPKPSELDHGGPCTRISRPTNPRARTTMIQLAWLWLRYQPGSELAKWFRNRVGTLAGRTRRIAIVAMARKLLIALWRYVETGVGPAG